MNREPDMRRVSDAYRDIANETTPADIDDRIMALARQEARTRYGRARARVRPVAWAATIALSFAFILEMTYFRDDALPVDAVVSPTMDSDAGQSAEPTTQEAPFKRAPAAVIAAPEIKTRDVAPLREAEDRERSDAATASFAEEAAVRAASKARAASRLDAGIDHCDAEARKTPDSWYGCVLALRDRGLHDAAEGELEALLETYPDFREPVPE